MLFAILSIISNLKNKNDESQKLISETYSAILFEAILCISALIISFALLFSNVENRIILGIFSFVLYYLIYAIILQIFIIIKRTSILLREKNKN